LGSPAAGISVSPSALSIAFRRPLWLPWASASAELRIDEIRVFYDVKETTVEILAIVSKTEAQKWLDKEGTPDPGSRVSEG